MLKTLIATSIVALTVSISGVVRADGGEFPTVPMQTGTTVEAATMKSSGTNNSSFDPMTGVTTNSGDFSTEASAIRATTTQEVKKMSVVTDQSMPGKNSVIVELTGVDSEMPTMPVETPVVEPVVKN